MYKWLVALLLLGSAAAAQPGPETTSPQLSVRVIAEVQIRVSDHGEQYARMVPADKVVPGDLVYYTLEVRNGEGGSLQSPMVVQPVPTHMVYVAKSAAGPGCEITFSTDGARTFAPPEKLKFTLPDGAQRPALARDYTHVRFRMASLVKPDSVVFMRFRARVK